jgi:hypothetical protein
MPAKKAKRREKKAASSKKAPARKATMGRKRVSGFKKQVAKELTVSPFERAGEATVDAARRLWLSAESLVTSQVVSLRRSVRKVRTKVSR